MINKFIFRAFIASLFIFLLNPLGYAATSDTQALFTNVIIFDGKSEKLLPGMNVLVVGNKIVTISEGSIKTTENATVITGAGRVLMPGMIDAHTHLAINHNIANIENDFTMEDVAIRSTLYARNWLMDGFTTVRDMGGPVFGLKRAVDAGEIVGPRIFPSGAFLSQTSGHGDFRSRNDRNPTLDGAHDANLDRMGFFEIADGRDQVLAATRQNLMQGATQIKIMAGGGGGSKYDPIDTTQYTFDEIKAAVEAASDWGTYVGAHIFTDKAIRRAIKAGVKSLEHGFFMNESTIKLVARNDVFVVPQMTGLSSELLRIPYLPKHKIPVLKALQAKAKDFVPLLLKHKVKVAYASDALGTPEKVERQRRYELYTRAEKFGNYETLKQATSVGGELLALSGLRNNYQGKLGVIEEGALADMLLVEGNPLEDIAVLGAKDKWFDAPMPDGNEGIVVIMKDGVVYKNTL